MRTIVIHHSADFDGIFCREIARKYVKDPELILGWDFGDPPIVMEPDVHYIVMDLPLDKPFGFEFKNGYVNWPGDRSVQPIDRVDWSNITWIDHHKSAIDSHPKEIPGYRLEGVAACRLAFQWFFVKEHNAQHARTGQLPAVLPAKQAFIDRQVPEPLAVRLAGEYDIWDKRDYRAEVFQDGLRSRQLDHSWWKALLAIGDEQKTILNGPEHWVDTLLETGEYLAYARRDEYANVIRKQGFTAVWHGIIFLVCNAHKLDIRSQLFEAAIMPHHQALLGFTFTGRDWSISMYHIKNQEDVNILDVAKANGGGGHPGACGCLLKSIPSFLYLDSVSRDIGEVQSNQSTNYEASKPVSGGEQPVGLA